MFKSLLSLGFCLLSLSACKISDSADEFPDGPGRICSGNRCPGVDYSQYVTGNYFPQNPQVVSCKIEGIAVTSNYDKSLSLEGGKGHFVGSPCSTPNTEIKESEIKASDYGDRVVYKGEVYYRNNDRNEVLPKDGHILLNCYNENQLADVIEQKDTGALLFHIKDNDGTQAWKKAVQSGNVFSGTDVKLTTNPQNDPRIMATLIYKVKTTQVMCWY